MWTFRTHPPRCQALAVMVACVTITTLATAQEPFSFEHHYIDRDLPGGSWGQTAAADLDNDGRLDFVTGRSRGDIHWYRQTANGWQQHLLGRDSPSDVGAAVLDVDRDGALDLVTGGAWYRNPGPDKLPGTTFERIAFDPDLEKVHDVMLADMNGDGAQDVLTMSDRNNLRWYEISQDPRDPWRRTDIGASVHAAIGAGDVDGDGDIDVARTNVWFENADSRGRTWKMHKNIPFGNPRSPFPLATHCVVRDMDRDGDADLVMTENEIRAGRAAWIENLDGRGGRWTAHILPQNDQAERGAYHSLIVADFDNDRDPDIFSCEMEHIRGAGQPRWFIWENADGRAGKFREHVILDARLGGHLSVAADFDQDGDLDIVSKLWRPRPDNANQGRNHVDLLENLLIP